MLSSSHKDIKKNNNKKNLSTGLCSLSQTGPMVSPCTEGHIETVVEQNFSPAIPHQLLCSFAVSNKSIISFYWNQNVINSVSTAAPNLAKLLCDQPASLIGFH